MYIYEEWRHGATEDIYRGLIGDIQNLRTTNMSYLEKVEWKK